MAQILYIYSDWTLLILRITVGLIFFAHGLPKAQDLKATKNNFEKMGFKPGVFWGTLIAILEVFGGAFLIVGLFTQALSFLFAIEMIVAGIWKIRGRMKLINGYELDLILLAALLVLVTIGSPTLALDHYFGIYLF